MSDDLVLLGAGFTDEGVVLERVREAGGVKRVWVWPGVVKAVVGGVRGRGV